MEWDGTQVICVLISLQVILPYAKVREPLP